MNSTLQTVLALALTALAAAFLVWTGWRKKRAAEKHGCGGDCGCHGELKIPAHLAKPKSR